MIVVFDGIDGTGKTTTAKEIARRTGAVYYPVPKGLSSLTERLYLFIKSVQPENTRVLLPAFLTSHAICSQEILDIHKSGRDVVMDRSLLSTFAYQYHGNVEEFQTLLKAVRMPKLPINKLVYMRTEETQIMLRIADRANDSLDKFSLDNHREILKRYEVGIGLLEQTSTVIYDNSGELVSDTVDNIQNWILDEI